ncbi:MAG: 3-deoxy-manno-octulosonate cytidylyltransferase [Gammaproteobacteria bacterium]|nr:3-deoxy-manno-octulosonate cytidylyltransferase [Gammaproteobacteria bacterium]MDH3468013.1 3-deoxy-manno-octulosonate cytidylyltransferase [Gammaproteobacteria bacterium]
MTARTFHVIIPARYASVRLPGKPLVALAGRPLIQHVYERAAQSGSASVTVATDDDRVCDTVAGFGGVVLMTESAHRSGTDRVAEAARQLDLADDAIVVNLQGDEPLMPPALIEQVARCLRVDTEAQIATAYTPITDTQSWTDNAVCKVVADQCGRALYFSRAAIPAIHAAGRLDACEAGLAARHIGIYAYRMNYLQIFASRPVCPIEEVECLEQLRALWYGDAITLCEATEIPGPGVDTAEDLEQVRRLLAS